MHKDIPQDLVLMMGSPAQQVANVEKITPPVIQYKTEDFSTRASMPAVKLPVGMEALALSFELAGYNEDILKNAGFSQGNSIPFTINGILIDGSGTKKNWKAIVTGFISKIDRGTFDMAGAKQTVSVEVACASYKELHAGATVIEIDPQNGTFNVDGKNQLGDLT